MHTPTSPGTVHDSAGPVQARLQQTPLTQNVETHWVPLVHDAPRVKPPGVGVVVGESVGVCVGVAVGLIVGLFVGVFVGVTVGVSVGVSVGVTVGGQQSAGHEAQFSPSALAHSKSPQHWPVLGLHVPVTAVPPTLLQRATQVGMSVDGQSEPSMHAPFC